MASRREIDEAEAPEEDDDPSAGEEAEQEDDGGGRRRRSRSKPSGRGRTRMQRFKAAFRDIRLEVYVFFFLGGLVLMVFGVAAEFSQGLLGPAMAAWFRSLGGAAPAFFLGALIVFGLAGYLFGGLITKRREFVHLVSTKAKSDFVRNLDKIERLAFELGTKESDIVAAKKREFKIRH